MTHDFRAIGKKLSNWGRWGKDDERGTTNLITPERIRQWRAEEGKPFDPAQYLPYNHAHNLFVNTLAERGATGLAVLLAVLADTPQSIAAIGYYTVTYGLTVIGAFGIATVVEARTGSCRIADFAGLAKLYGWRYVIVQSEAELAAFLTANRGNVAAMVAAGRARWKIENEAFNTLKTKGYNLEHNFGHGERHLAPRCTSRCALVVHDHRAGKEHGLHGVPGCIERNPYLAARKWLSNDRIDRGGRPGQAGAHRWREEDHREVGCSGRQRCGFR